MKRRPIVPLLVVAATCLGALAVPVAAKALSSRTVAPAAPAAPAVVPGRATAAALDQRLAEAAPDERVLVFVKGTSLDAARAAVTAAGLQAVDAFERIDVVVAAGTPAQVRAAEAHPGVVYVQADEPIRFFLDTSHVATRGEEAYRGFEVTTTTTTTTTTGKDKKNPRSKGGKGETVDQDTDVTHTSAPLDGSGVTIAVIDSGVDGTHPAFTAPDGTSKVVRNLKFACPFFYACDDHELDGEFADGNTEDSLWVEDPTNRTDTGSNGGHGTHVAGIAAGYEDAAVRDGVSHPLHGAAPGAKLVGLSVGQTLSVYAGFAGMNWVAEHHADPCGPGVADDVCPPVKVVNNSWGPIGGGAYDPNSVEDDLQELLVAEGVTVVWAAGNDGGDGTADTTNPEGKSPLPGVISVANYDDFDTGTRDGALDSSSSRGLRTDPTTFPDVSAPGATITSACGPQLPVCYLHGDTGDDTREYYTIGGTSMAAPHVAGIVAQLLQADPTLTPGAIENLLEDTAYKFAAGGMYGEHADPTNPDDTTSFDKGHGLVDVKAAVAKLRAIPGVESPDPEQTATCTAAGPVMTDGRGDATDLGSVGGAAPNEPALDVRRLDLAWDASAAELTFRIGVDDLGPLNPPSAPNISFNSTFVYDGLGYYVEGIRSAAGTTSFGVGLMEEVDAAVTGAVVRAPGGVLSEGAFDADNDVVTIVLPSSALEALGAPPLADGATVRGIDAVSRRSATPALFAQGLSADVGDAQCAYTLGTGAVDPPPPAPDPDEPADGEVAKGGPAHAWSGNPPFDANASPFTDVACILPDDPRCDNEYVRVVLPAGQSGKLRLTVRAVTDGDDFGVALYDPDGNFVDAVDSGNREEVLEVPLGRAGVYRVAVYSFLSLDGAYDATASLT